MQAGNQQESVVYLLLEGTLGWKYGVPGLSVQAPPSPSKPTHRSGTEAHPRHAEAESHAGNGRALAPASQTWVYPLSGKSVPGHAQAGDVPAAEGQSNLQGKAIRTDAVSRPARTGGCESGPSEMPGNPEERLYQYTAIDEYTRLRYLGAYPEQSTYSSADFLEKMAAWFKRRGVRVECVQTDNGFEFTNRFSNSKRDLPTRFELTAARLGIRHKLIRPVHTPPQTAK